MSQKIASKVKLIQNQHLVSDFFIASFEYFGPAPKPGQFVNLEVKPYTLKRPFAVFDYQDNVLSLLYKVVGKGTKEMSQWTHGEEAEILCPLGNFFKEPQKDEAAIMIGGGTGIASLYFMARSKRDKQKVLLGLNNLEEAKAFQSLFESTGTEVQISTMDGSFGFHGNVIQMTEALMKDEGKYSLYACGPHPMLEALHSSITSNKLSPQNTWVSLEARMGCGFGVCLGCAVEKEGEGFYYVCKDGPIFNMNELKWNVE